MGYSAMRLSDRQRNPADRDARSGEDTCCFHWLDKVNSQAIQLVFSKIFYYNAVVSKEEKAHARQNIPQN